ncbi:hypothetical protein CEB94_25095 [Streptomyces hawaiiensis]|uniref:Uncharacterized protein n=1 Tax=Streptomyces hawaiiensis TaxID=67305 RepID=A0A6G5RHY2_9ACTN|nr:hypothetical protein CEB94_25095 [Streptomyces hawaiiensis]
MATFSENLCQPLPAEILPGRPEMLTSTLVSSHTEGSGSGDSDSSGSDALGAGEDSLAEALGELDVSGADSLTEALGLGVVSGVDSLTDGEGDVSGADSLTDVLGLGVVSSVAYAAGAASSATGAMTAVAAAAAMARRSFMKTSESPAYRGMRHERWGRPPRVGRGSGPWFGRFDP